MDPNWWKQAKGTKTRGPDDYQNKIEQGPENKLVIVDFYMPQCSYCVKFMPSWNKIVDEFTAEYGDQIEFLKVDGIEDRSTSMRYGVSSFPSFIAMTPGSYGDNFKRWSPSKRDYMGMRKWINGLIEQYEI